MYYESHFGFSEPPFSISPDPRYLYLTQGHREALAHLLYGVSGGGGFVLLTGEVGSGKTTVCRCLLQQLPEDVDVALVLNPKLGPLEFLEAICDELQIGIYSEHPITLKWLVDHLYKYLLAAHSKGRNTVLIVDEAQNLSPDVIEHLRLLTNLETDEKKLLQIILIGQPELRDLIGSPALRQMAQRVTARFHLDLLSKSDAGAYVEHRLKVAGCDRPLFESRAIRYIWKKSGGVPRLMNAICDRALLGASMANKQRVSFPIVRKAVEEVLGSDVRASKPRRPWPAYARAVAGMALLIFGAVVLVKLTQGGWFSSRLDELSLYLSGGNLVRASGNVGGEEEGFLTSTPRLADAGKQTVEPDTAVEMRLAEQPQEPDAGGGLNPADASPGGRIAYTSLYRRWGIDYVSRDTRSDCTYLRNHDLRCHQGWTDLPTLVSLNRPAVLTLRGENNDNTDALLHSLNSDQAIMYGQHGEKILSLDELKRLWTGQYLLLWRAPGSYSRVVRSGDQGEVVAWINKRLSPENSELVNVFNETMVRRVRLFQQVYGLVADGEVGPLTMIALNNFSGAASPGLREVSNAEATAARE